MVDVEHRLLYFFYSTSTTAERLLGLTSVVVETFVWGKMANITAVTFLAGLMMILAASGSGEQCPRYSPEDIWYSDMAPLLNETHLEGKKVK